MKILNLEIESFELVLKKRYSIFVLFNYIILFLSWIICITLHAVACMQVMMNVIFSKFFRGLLAKHTAQRFGWILSCMAC